MIRLPKSFSELNRLCSENNGIYEKGQFIFVKGVSYAEGYIRAYFTTSKDGFFGRRGTDGYFPAARDVPPEYKYESSFANQSGYEHFIRLFREKRKAPNKNQVHLGTEIELEGPVFTPNDKSLFHSSHADSSVDNGGCEVVTKHFPVKDWKLCFIKNFMREAITEYRKAGPSAGQHIHISHPKILRMTAYWRDAIQSDSPERKFYNLMAGLSSRHSSSYGFNLDSYRNQFSEFGTFEFRMFESTNHAEVIFKRIRLIHWLTCYLIKKQTCLNLWRDMPNSILNIVSYLNNHTDNPHTFGTSKDLINNMIKAKSWL